MRQEWGSQETDNVPRPLASSSLASDSRQAGRSDGEQQMKTIKLYLKGNTWVADWVDDTSVFELFGTTKLPTMFRGDSPAEEVQAAIQQFNPEYSVTTP